MKVKNDNAIIRYFLKEMWRHRSHAIGIIVITPLAIIIARYLGPLLIAYVLQQIQSGTVTVEGSLWIILGYFAIQIIGDVVGFRIVLSLMWTIQIRGWTHLYQRAFEKLSKQSLSFYSSSFTGSLVSKVTRFADAFNSFVNVATYQVYFMAISIIASLIGIGIFLWPYALVLLAFTIVFVICAYFGTRFMRPKFKARSEAYTQASGKLADAIGNMIAVKTDSGETGEQAVINKGTMRVLKKELAVQHSFLKTTSVYTSIMAMMRTAAIIASILIIQTGVGNAATVYICLTYTFNLLEEIWNINNLLRSYYQITGDAAETLETIEKTPDVIDRTDKKLRVTNAAIAFKNISFTHHDTAEKDEDTQKEPEQLFTDFSLHIPAGQKTGIVGVSGSGKTTLVRLLMRFYDIDSGSITIDDQDISEVTQSSLHKQLAYVSQEPTLFHRSIKDNISYSNPKASFADIKRAAKQANALEFIEKLPNGFDTLVGERGVKLSGGQRQRITIARAILKDAPVLILDEATSALDSESEALIQDALVKLMKGRTSIVIAHRLSTIAALDRIVVLTNGTIEEQGSHKELLANNGSYAKLWQHQSGGFIEE